MAPFTSPTAKFHSTTYPTLNPERPELSAKGKSVLITGGGTGIGAETAKYFAAAGAPRIALLGRREQPLLETKAALEQKHPGLEVFVAATDVTKKDQVDEAFLKFAGKSGLDVVVSGAAIIGPQDPVAKADSEKFLYTVQQNMAGAIHTAQAFIRHASKGAVAIDINSSAAHHNFGDGFSCYNVAKLAVFRLWDSLAVGNPEISVFHIQPGVVNTDMNKEAGGVDMIGYEDHVSLPASFNVWLASPEAQFLKGKFLWVNWDVDELKARSKELENSTLLTMGLVGYPFDGSIMKLG
ncbi:NAD(P)-binding protein [Pseudovirgaria hyperparasitica]|uniref:NAD(P)-binding protein n=1 Tax=Pseudovirgaria hyperparasitica TaxID=470096 RepID=A0A6A6WD60_9PEZI|nr:NAD(P)-binding protein [Pseudovirgaria hyperparasitica]KAF2759900.1 NAD(P)-binding protein [Pseudovirgaria hyperparasitica]